MKATDLADEIHREIGSPTDLPVASVAYWVQNNIGQLNILIGSEVVYDVEINEFLPELSTEQANIFKNLYLVKHYSSQVKANLGAASYDWSEISEGDSKIRRVSKNEIAKTYKQMRDSADMELMRLVNRYNRRQSAPVSYDRADLVILDDIY